MHTAVYEHDTFLGFKAALNIKFFYVMEKKTNIKPPGPWTFLAKYQLHIHPSLSMRRPQSCPDLRLV